MVVRCHLTPENGFTFGFAPPLREGQEKALFASEAADYDVSLAFQ
jgi:hypothetical protein